MGNMSLADLRKLRDSKRNALRFRDSAGKPIRITVGMGTCGIAAGAKAVLDAFISALDTDNLMETVLVKQSGCMGFCPQEPTVEVAVPGMDTAVYGRVDPAAVREIVSKHIINKQFLDDHILNRRAATQ